MGIHLAWDDDAKTILCHTYDGNWTVDDLYNAIDQSAQWLQERDYPVDLIIDMRTSASPPPGVLSVYHYAEKKAPPNQRLVVMVQVGVMNAFNRVIKMIAPTISEQRFQVETMEEARALIAEYRAGLVASE